VADEFNFEFDERDLAAALREFTELVARSVVRSALRQIAKTIRDAIADAAPKRTGKLDDNIAVSTSYAAARGVIKARVIVRTIGKAIDPRNAFYWRFVEFGHKTRPGKRGSQHEVPAHSFVRPAGDAAQSYAADEFFGALDRAIDKTFTRQG